MFEWLEQEISEIRTPRFHVVDGPREMALQEVIMQSDIFVPDSYKNFVLKFGCAKLYRRAKNNSYQVGVFSAPRETTLNDGTGAYQLGFHDGASVYVKATFDSIALPIYEYESGLEKKVGDNFHEWLEAVCTHVRNSYGLDEWTRIQIGPEPFTEKELKVIIARRRIHWRVLSVDLTGDFIFEIANSSDQKLPVLTVGVRSKDRRLNGTTFLQIAHIGPGQTETIRAACYKGIIAPAKLEMFTLPDPQPEDRERYIELGSENGTGQRGHV